MNNVYMSVRLTNFGMNHPLNEGVFYLSVETSKLEICHSIGYQDAMKEMAKLAKRLGKLPIMEINAYNPNICYWSLSGYID